MNKLQKQIDQYQSLTDASIFAKVSYRKLQRAVQKGLVPSVKLPGGRVVVHPNDALAFAQRIGA